MKSGFFTLAFCILFLQQLGRLIFSLTGIFEDHTNIQRDIRHAEDDGGIRLFDSQFPVTNFVEHSSEEERFERKVNLQSSCASSANPKSWSKLTAKQKAILHKHIIVSDKYKFLYCYSPKVACSNWKRVVMLLTGVSDKYEKDHPHDLTYLSNYNEKEIQRRLQTYYKFTFVRNPLERLLSAYRNKFGEIEDSMRTYGVKIKEKYGNSTKKQQYEGKIPGDDVSFEEFIRFLLDHSSTESMNEHWTPMNTLCQPCAVKYDFIGSYDNLYEDSEEVLKQIKAPSDVHFPGRQSYYSPTTYATTAYYYSLVKNEYMHALISKYLQDFNLFSYPLPKMESHSG